MNLSIQGLKVLKSLLDATDPLSGADIRRATHVKAGTLYPLLRRFEESKVVSGSWESTRPQELGHPRRKFYELTKHGTAFAEKMLKDFDFA